MSTNICIYVYITYPFNVNYLPSFYLYIFEYMSACSVTSSLRPPFGSAMSVPFILSYSERGVGN